MSSFQQKVKEIVTESRLARQGLARQLLKGLKEDMEKDRKTIHEQNKILIKREKLYKGTPSPQKNSGAEKSNN